MESTVHKEAQRGCVALWKIDDQIHIVLQVHHLDHCCRDVETRIGLEGEVHLDGRDRFAGAETEPTTNLKTLYYFRADLLVELK